MRWGSFRSLEPINLGFGCQQGTPIDRIYIENFLAKNSARITGRVLEIGDRSYTKQFGGDAVTQSDVLTHELSDSESHTQESDISSANNCTDSQIIVGRLEACPEIANDTYNCILLTQTLHYIPDMRAAVSEIHRILKPGGTVLCTVPGISQISRWDMDRWGDRWRMTPLAARELFAVQFGAESVEATSYGNVTTAVAFLEGIPAEKLKAKELDCHDPDYPILVAVTGNK